MKIAIVHPWFLAQGGAEHTVNVLAEMYPQADFFTLLYNDRDLPSAVRGRTIKASGANVLPWKYRLYRYLMPFYARAFEAIDLRGYDLVITSDSCVAKGVLIDQGARQICYCHSPMRGLWDARYEFRDMLPVVARPVYSWFTHSMRQWDFQAAQRVDYFVANSKYVAERIERYYRRGSQIIYPPVDMQTGPVSSNHDDYYLSVGRLTETKRVDLLIQACNQLKRRLIIVGTGRHEATLKKVAGPTIQFTGRASGETLDKLYRSCRALLFSSNEDFGIVPVEAQSYGKPVIAFGHGGSLETVVGLDQCPQQPLPTGVFYPEQTAASLRDAILRFEEAEGCFDPVEIQQHAFQFDRTHFENAMRDVVARVQAGTIN